jgi:hypothetical protein
MEQLALLVLQTGTQLRRDDILSYVDAVIDVFVQLERKGGERRIGEVRLNPRLTRVAASPGSGSLAVLPERRRA